jgi:hypothetical protein
MIRQVAAHVMPAGESAQRRSSCLKVLALGFFLWLAGPPPFASAIMLYDEVGVGLLGDRRMTSTPCFTDGTVKNAQKISVLYGNLNTTYNLDAGDEFASSLAAVGDLDSDGVTDLAVGAHFDDDGSTDAGAVYVVFLETSGNVKAVQKLSMLYGNFNAFYALKASDRFGSSLAALGDIDDDGIADLAAGAAFDDDGGTNTGAVYVLFLKTNGIVKGAQKVSTLAGNFNTFYTLTGGDIFGYSAAALGDIDGDSVMDLAVGSFLNDDGVTSAGALYVLFLGTNGHVEAAQKISMLYGNFNSYYTLVADDRLGFSVAGIGDVNGDNVMDLAAGALDNEGGTDGLIIGAVYVLFLETNGSIKGAQKLSMLYGNFNSFHTLGSNDQFGSAVAALGDINGDGVVDLAVGARVDDDGAFNTGALYVLFLETDGAVTGVQKQSMLYGNVNAFYTLDSTDRYGFAVVSLGDNDGDGVADFAVGAVGDDDGGTNAGAVYVMNLEQSYCETPSPTVTPCFTDGSVKVAQKLSSLYGNLNTFYTLNASNCFGASIAMLNDIDSDGVIDLAVGVREDNDGGTQAGAVYLLFLETNGMIKDAKKISQLYSNLNAFYSLYSCGYFPRQNHHQYSHSFYCSHCHLLFCSWDLHCD